jgi:hypothetical protein
MPPLLCNEQAQSEGRQYQELSDALRTEMQQVSHERQGLLEERSRLQYRWVQL